jgi:hypothetical protein
LYFVEISSTEIFQMKLNVQVKLKPEERRPPKQVGLGSRAQEMSEKNTKTLKTVLADKKKDHLVKKFQLVTNKPLSRK